MNTIENFRLFVGYLKTKGFYQIKSKLLKIDDVAGKYKKVKWKCPAELSGDRMKLRPSK